jgi:hypothetical protein
MFSLTSRPGDRLPFTTLVVDQVRFIQTHRDRFNNHWKEPMTLDVHLLAVNLAAIPPIANDNEKRVNHG